MGSKIISLELFYYFRYHIELLIAIVGVTVRRNVNELPCLLVSDDIEVTSI